MATTPKRPSGRPTTITPKSPEAQIRKVLTHMKKATRKTTLEDTLGNVPIR